MIRVLLADADADADKQSGRERVYDVNDETSFPETVNDVNGATENHRLLFVHSFQNALALQNNAYLRHDSHAQYDREDSKVRNYSKSLRAARCAPPGVEGIHLPAPPPPPPPRDDELQFFNFLGLESHSFLSVCGVESDVNLADLMPQRVGQGEKIRSLLQAPQSQQNEGAAGKGGGGDRETNEAKARKAQAAQGLCSLVQGGDERIEGMDWALTKMQERLRKVSAALKRREGEMQRMEEEFTADVQCLKRRHAAVLARLEKDYKKANCEKLSEMEVLMKQSARAHDESAKNLIKEMEQQRQQDREENNRLRQLLTDAAGRAEQHVIPEEPAVTTLRACC
jgi:hypothetical protein